MLATSLQLILKRAIAHWKLLIAVVVGVMLAVTIMATSSVYFDSLRELGLQRVLNDYPDTQLDVLVDASIRPIDDGSHGSITNVIDNRVVRPLARHLHGKNLALRSWTFFFAEQPPPMAPANECPCVHRPNLSQDDGGPAQMIECDCRRISFLTVPEQDQRITILQGRPPKPVVELPAGDQTLMIEGLVSAETAALFDLSVGSVLAARPFWDEEHSSVEAVITGIYRRSDQDDPVWRIWRESFNYRGTTLEFADVVVPEETLRGALAAYFPFMGAEYAWLLNVNASSIHPTDTPRIRGAIDHLVGQLSANVNGFRFRSQLPDALERFEIELFFNRLPMFIVLILIVLIALYYVVTLGSMLVDAQKPEIAMLRSRGATSVQILAVFVVEAALLSAGALAVCPFLALGAVSLTGIVPGLADLNGGAALPVRLTGEVYRLAALGSGLTLLALMIPAIRASRIGLLRERRSRTRPNRLAVAQRYYLDLGFLGIVLFLFWQLTKQGSFVATRLLGETAVNQLILAAPAVFLVAAALVILRVFPLILDVMGRLLASRYASGLTPLAIVLGIWQMSRNPAHYMQLGLLIILGAGLGVFAATFAATLERSAQDGALYESGADVRVTSFTMPTGGQSYSMKELIAGVDSVETVATVNRLRSFPAGGLNFDTFNLLAVDVENFAAVAYERDDFMAGNLHDSISKIKLDDPPPLRLPDGTERISLAVRPTTPRPDVNVFARMSDANSRYFSVNLGSLTPQSDLPGFRCDQGNNDSGGGWCRIGANVNPTGRRALHPKPPIYLHYIGIWSFDELQPGQFLIDDISAHTRLAEQQTVLEDFQSVKGWHELRPGRRSLGDAFTQALDSSGNPLPGIGRFRWTEGVRGEARGFSASSLADPMPALATQSFMDSYGAEIGDTLAASTQSTAFDVQVVETIDYFPTMDPQDDPFLIVDVNALHRRVNTASPYAERSPNEYWASVAGPIDHDRLAATLNSNGGRYREVIDRVDVLQRAAIDPLVSAGWKALLGLAFITVLIVAALGFTVHSRISFEARRGEFATLRSVGMSMRQLASLVLTEQLLIIATAVGFGVFLGLRTGAIVMPYLANTSVTGQITPPMLLEVDWSGFAVTFGLFFIVFAVVLAILVATVYRTAIHSVMRASE